MIHIVLFQPEIPQNTGNIGRLCACTNSILHLIHPLGFKISDKHLRRSGMDYWEDLEVIEHKNWEDFTKNKNAPKRLWLLTTKANKAYWDVKFEDGDGIVFGSEGSGCPDWLHDKLSDSRLTIPMPNPKMRSLNLATSVGIVRYEISRQFNQGGGPGP